MQTKALKTASKKVIQKTAEAIADLIGSKIADKIAKVSRISPKNSLETVTNKTEDISLDRDIPKNIYKSPEKKYSKLLII